MSKFTTYKNWVNEKFQEESDPIRDMGIGKFKINFREIAQPILDEYNNDKSECNYSKKIKYFKRFKKEIEPLIINKYIKGKLWKGENFEYIKGRIIYVKNITMNINGFFNKKPAWAYFTLIDDDGDKCTLYLDYPYIVSPSPKF